MKSRWVIFFGGLGALLVYTDRKLENFLPSHPFGAGLITIGLFLLMFGPHFWGRSETSRINSRSFQWVVWIGSILMGVWATFILFWLPVDLGRGIFFLVRIFSASNNSSLTPGISLGICLSSAFVVLSAGIAGFGLSNALTGPRVREVFVPVSHLPEELNGLKIVQLTDFHIGPTIRKGYVDQVVQKVLDLKPDLIAITGDLADGPPEILKEQVEPLSQLKAPLGVYFVTGNHEYFWDTNGWIEKVRALGFIPLMNENRVVKVGEHKLLVAGITDAIAGQFIEEQKSDIKKAVLTDEKTEFKILLAHRPGSCLEAEPLGFDLQLSGHTHGGQFFPFNLLMPLFHRYYRGLNRHGNMWVYVNVGTGYWGPPNRFWIPAEITLLRLKTEMVKSRHQTFLTSSRLDP